MRVFVGMNASLLLRSPLLYNRLSSLYPGVFVVKLSATHTHTHREQLCHWFYRPLTLVTRREREVLNKRAKECEYDRCRAFFCHLKHAHFPPSLRLFGTHGWSVGRPTCTLSQLCFQQKHLVQWRLPGKKHVPFAKRCKISLS